MLILIVDRNLYLYIVYVIYLFTSGLIFGGWGELIFEMVRALVMWWAYRRWSYYIGGFRYYTFTVERKSNEMAFLVFFCHFVRSNHFQGIVSPSVRHRTSKHHAHVVCTHTAGCHKTSGHKENNYKQTSKTKSKIVIYICQYPVFCLPNWKLNPSIEILTSFTLRFQEIWCSAENLYLTPRTFTARSGWEGGCIWKLAITLAPYTITVCMLYQSLKKLKPL